MDKYIVIDDDDDEDLDVEETIERNLKNPRNFEFNLGETLIAKSKSGESAPSSPKLITPVFKRLDFVSKIMNSISPVKLFSG